MIELNNDVIKEIANALVTQDSDSRFLYLQSINNESGEGTQNSWAVQKWDLRYNNILKVAIEFDLKYIKLGRGKLWEAIAILGPKDEIYVFFSKHNLKRIMRKGKNSHYLRLLNMFNEALDERTPLNQQLALDICEEDGIDKEYWKKQAREMLQAIETDPSKVIVFGFDISFVATVKAYVFNTSHQLVWEKDLSELIDVNYQSVLKDDYVEPAMRESSNINVTKSGDKRIVKLRD